MQALSETIANMKPRSQAEGRRLSHGDNNNLEKSRKWLAKRMQEQISVLEERVNVLEEDQRGYRAW